MNQQILIIDLHIYHKLTNQKPYRCHKMEDTTTIRNILILNYKA